MEQNENSHTFTKTEYEKTLIKSGFKMPSEGELEASLRDEGITQAEIDMMKRVFGSLKDWRMFSIMIDALQFEGFQEAFGNLVDFACYSVQKMANLRAGLKHQGLIIRSMNELFQGDNKHCQAFSEMLTKRLRGTGCVRLFAPGSEVAS